MILYSSGDLKSNMRTVLQRNHRPQYDPIDRSATQYKGNRSHAFHC